MKRLLVLLAAAGGVAFWWRRRSGDAAGTDSADSFNASSRDNSEPGALGGEVSQELLEILACPLDKQPVTRQGNYLVCGECQRHYAIRDGIPVMLIDEALTPEQAAAKPS